MTLVALKDRARRPKGSRLPEQAEIVILVHTRLAKGDTFPLLEMSFRIPSATLCLGCKPLAFLIRTAVG